VMLSHAAVTAVANGFELHAALSNPGVTDIMLTSDVSSACMNVARVWVGCVK
jgi:hypothetical protein